MLAHAGGCALLAAATYYVASFIQTVFHRVFGHTRRVAKLYDVHVKGHHGQYSRALLSDRWIPTEQHVTWYYAIPFAPIVFIAFWYLPLDFFLAHLAALGGAIWWHVYLHRQYHLRNSWFGRFAWFRRKQHLHFVHHQRPNRNYAVVEYFWDRLFRTFALKPSRRESEHPARTTG